MKLAEMITKTDKELRDLVTETRKQLVTQLIDSRTKQVANVKAVGATKRQLAQALTIERQRQETEATDG